MSRDRKPVMRMQALAVSSLLLLATAGCQTATPTATVSPETSAEASVAPSPDFSLIEPGVLTVAVYVSAPPAIVTGPGENELGGLEGAWLNTFAEKFGLEIELVETEFASVILFVEQGNADVGTDVFYNEERAMQVWYTYPFFISSYAILTLSDFAYDGVDSLETVGTVTGQAQTPYVQEAFGDNAILFPGDVEVGTALLNGQIDGVATGTGVILAPPYNGSPDVVEHLLEPGELGIPENELVNFLYNFVNCSNPELAAAMNEVMTEMHESGEWLQALEDNGLTEDYDTPLEEPEQLCST